jgi:hypothetical protein
MKNIIRLLALSMIVGMVLWLAGCTEETTAPTPLKAPSTEIKTIQPKGYITGKIIDRCTGMAISGAVVSLGYGDTTHYFTSADGNFAFANVPAGQYQTTALGSVFTGTYNITISMKNINLQQTDPTKRYKDYYYQTVIINFTSLVPGDSLGVSGLVGSAVCTLATLSPTLKGTVVDQNLLPVAAASVIILDHFTSNVLAQTTTGADGSFQISNLENGSSFDIRAKSFDGSLQATVSKSLLCNLLSDSLRTQVLVEQIVLGPVDNVAPFVISISPSNNSDVAVGTSIVYTFSESIKQTPYTTNGAGYGGLADNIHVNYVGLKKSTADVPMTSVTWSNNNTVLTIVPSGLVGSRKYSVTIDLTNLTDLAGNAVVDNTALVGDFEALNFTTAGGSAVPLAPILGEQIIPGVYTIQNYAGGGTISLEWNYDANARSYNIYRSVNGGSFDILETNIQFTQYQTTCPALYAGTLSDPIGTANVRYRVTGVSKDLVEGAASNIITVTDQVKPQLIYFPAPGAVAGATNSWVYRIGFNEPMSQATIEAISNYTFSNTGGVIYTINKVTYAGWDGAEWRAYLEVTSSVAPVAGYILTTASAITDLAGNGIDPAANSHAY